MAKVGSFSTLRRFHVVQLCLAISAILADPASLPNENEQGNQASAEHGKANEYDETSLSDISSNPLKRITPEVKRQVIEFCRCDRDRIYWPNFVHSVGYECWRSLRKVAPFHFADAQQIFLENFRPDALEEFEDVASTCPIGALNIATVVGSIFEAHDLGERNYVDLDYWMQFWRRFAQGVIEYTEALGSRTLDCREVWDRFFSEENGQAVLPNADAEQNQEKAEGRLEAQAVPSGEDERGLRDESRSGAENNWNSNSIGTTPGDVESSELASSMMENVSAADVVGSEQAAEQEFLPFVFDVPRFTLMLKRMFRKLIAWQRLMWEDGSDTPTAREAAVYESFRMQVAEINMNANAREEVETKSCVDKDHAVATRPVIQQQGEDSSTPTDQHCATSSSPITTTSSSPTSSSSTSSTSSTIQLVPPPTLAEHANALGQLREELSLSLCIVYGNGARSFEHALNTYEQTGLLFLAKEKFLTFLEDPVPPSEGEPSEQQSGEGCWRSGIMRKYGLQELGFDAYAWPETHIKISRTSYMRTGKAFASCAMQSSADHILFLEDDWEVIARPPELVWFRLRDAVSLLRQQKADLVHLRHKLFYGPPYYELLTSLQHNEPPPTSLALYFAEDPVEADFPAEFWNPPFREHGTCDNNRTSWLRALKYQRSSEDENGALYSSAPTSIEYAEAGTRSSSSSRESGEAVEANSHMLRTTSDHGPGTSSSTTSSTSKNSFLEWCDQHIMGPLEEQPTSQQQSGRSGSVCADTRLDPFRNMFYTTNPTMYRRKDWIRYFASTVAILGDARAVEEAITVSYTWRVDPGFRVAFSPGLFRHKRVDRKPFGECSAAGD
ncbi:unnamed protein product [Amoebophrya sp. A25]|nr:unnamed protein product [Amoebophrya sp. A25]|eukprot:GSA25T00025360001.1